MIRTVVRVGLSGREEFDIDRVGNKVTVAYDEEQEDSP